MDEIEVAELPEKEREERKDRLNMLIAITVTTLVTFLALCKINDNNTVLAMQQVEASKIDHWSWYQAINVRSDIHDSKLADLKADLDEERNPARRKILSDRIATMQAASLKLEETKENVKKKAEADKDDYEILNVRHEKFDRSEAFISIAVSLLAITSLLQLRWMYLVALIPACMGLFKGVTGLMG